MQKHSDNDDKEIKIAISDLEEDFDDKSCCEEIGLCDDFCSTSDESSDYCDGLPTSEFNALELSPKELGNLGELAARVFLKRKGFEILETNWTCFAGEADIIALDEGTLCFIEVKTRSDVRKGFPEEAVDEKKRSRYEKIAACYLQSNSALSCCIRFDVVSIILLSHKKAFLRYHSNAYGGGL